MDLVIWAAAAIGGSTLLGTGCGFLLDRVSDKMNDMSVAFAAGVMLSAAVFGLFVPAMDMAQGWNCAAVLLGAVCGVLFLRLIYALSEKIGRGNCLADHPELMFVVAIAVHKFPEGMAGGVGLYGADPAASVLVPLGVALQNLPEGAVMIPPMIAAGMKKSRAALIALATGLLNAAGVFAGALWGSLSGAILPFALSFAGGAMLDVILFKMVPAVSASKYRGKSAVLMGGFLAMAAVNMLF